jgi:hypothetical protein
MSGDISIFTAENKKGKANTVGHTNMDDTVSHSDIA